MLQRIQRITEHLKKATDGFVPETGIILGTGLSGLGKEIEVKHAIPYGEIPEFPVSTVQGHPGRLLFGMLGGKPVVAMQGRFHFYEGWTMEEVEGPTPVRPESLVATPTDLFIAGTARFSDEVISP